MKSVPYILSYATYIAATIHVRIAAQKGTGSVAFDALQICLNALHEHSMLYSAASDAKRVIHILMSRMGLHSNSESRDIGETSNPILVLNATESSLQLCPGLVQRRACSSS